MIKDSGNRQEFETGAVRDMQEGKGRCDLMPLRVLACIGGYDVILDCIAEFQEEDGIDSLFEAFENFAFKAFGDEATALLELSVHFEEGAKKYGERNWEKGIPESCYIDSAIRHYLKYKRGDDDERHDRAFLWNIICLIHSVMKREKK